MTRPHPDRRPVKKEELLHIIRKFLELEVFDLDAPVTESTELRKLKSRARFALGMRREDT